jgi:hypothetical protein
LAILISTFPSQTNKEKVGGVGGVGGVSRDKEEKDEAT